MPAAALIALLALAIPTCAQTLKIARPAISHSEDGPPAENAAVFQPGDILFFSFQVENYKVGAAGKVQLTGHVAVSDPKGTLIIPGDEEVVGTSISEEDKSWKPKLRLQIQIPSFAPPGQYKIKFDVADQQARQSAADELAFTVGGKGVAPAEVLTIRNLAFYRAQEEETSLKLAAYRAGDIVWVRFDAVGYKYGEQNSIDVSYDVTVLSPDGTHLFSQENAAVEKSQAFYPQPWIPAVFNLTLQSNMRPGTYKLVIAARDTIGNQTATERADFRVE
ncbi:MAG: hypothetical protein M3N93_05985 [Acidobacteriota bacterium]|nr:hypothetical protein [Acidobacteriota bacterium]